MKGQLSTFLIAAILTVLAASLFLFLRQENPPTPPTIQENPAQIRPAEAFIEKCLTDTTRIGLELLGEHGGYVEPLSQGIVPSSIPTEGNSVRLFPESEIIIPYWYYLSSTNDCTSCTYSSAQPALTGTNSMSSQLARYIETHLQDCTRDFSELDQQGITVTPKGTPSVSIDVLSTLLVKLTWPLSISDGTTTTTTERFITALDLDLATLYQAAALLTDIQSKAHVFEAHTLNIIAAYSGIDKNKLPPMWETDVRPGKQVIWSKTAVKTQLTDLITSHIPLVQVYNSANYRYRPKQTELAESLYNTGTLIPGNTSFQNYEITFTYLPTWEPYFDLDCNGELCQPQGVISDLIPIGITRYTKAYDLSYPVIVTLHDPNAFHGEGYSFQYLIEVNIRNNEPLPTNFQPLRQPSTGQELCQAQHRTSGTQTISVTNAYTNEPLDDVTIGFNCGDTGCVIGTTDNGELSSKFPVCLGGTLKLFGDDLFSETHTLNTLQEEANTNLQAWPMLQPELTIRKWNIVKQGNQWQVQQNPTNLEDYEEVILSLTRQGTPHVTATHYYQDEYAPSLKLVPGDYQLTINVLSHDTITIPEREECYLGNCITMPSATFNDTNPLPVGTATTNVTITSAMLTSGELTFYVPSYDFSNADLILEDLSLITQLNWNNGALNPTGGTS